MIRVLFFKIFKPLLPVFFVFFFCCFVSFVHSLQILFVLFFCCLPVLFHSFEVRFHFFHLFSFNDDLFVLNSFEKVKEFWILKTWIWIIHHDLKHRRRTIHYTFLFSFLCDCGFLETLLHLHLVLPLFSLLLNWYLFKLFCHHLFLHSGHFFCLPHLKFLDLHHLHSLSMMLNLGITHFLSHHFF